MSRLIEGPGYVGDFLPNEIVYMLYSTFDADGGQWNRTSIVDTRIYINNSTTQTTGGITEDANFDSRVGKYLLAIDLSGAFYKDHSDFNVVLNTVVQATFTVSQAIGSFSIRNRAGWDQRHYRALVKIWTPKRLLESE